MEIAKISTINDVMNLKTLIGKTSSALDFKSILAGEIEQEKFEIPKDFED